MTTITLPPRCDRAAVRALLPELVAAGSTALSIDAAHVEQAGQALLQLLLSARRHSPGTVITPSAALIDAAALAGLDAELFDGDPR